MDNVIWKGKVADPELVKTDEATGALFECVKALKNDARVEICTVMLADGLTVVRKK